MGILRPPDTDFQIVLHEDGRVRIHILRLGQTIAQASATGLVGNQRGESATYQCSGNVALTDRMTVEFLPPDSASSPPATPISFQVKAKADTPVNSIITNTASIQSAADVYTRSAILSIRTVDLAASVKRASRVDLLPGESVTYTLIVANGGQATAEQVALTDTLPAGLVLSPGSLLCAAGGCQAAGNVITWLGDLLPGRSVTLAYSAALSSVLADRTPLTNTMEVRASGLPVLQRSAVVYARSTNLSASAFDFGGKPNEPGDRFTLSALLRNTGLQATSIDFSLPLPPELSLVAGTVRCGIGQCRVDAGRLLWSGSLPPRGLVAVQMDVELASYVVSGQRIPLLGQMVDHTWGLTHPLKGELVVALHLMIPLLEGLGIEPPLYLPLIAQ